MDAMFVLMFISAACKATQDTREDTREYNLALTNAITQHMKRTGNLGGKRSLGGVSVGISTAKSLRIIDDGSRKVGCGVEHSG